MIDVKKVAEVVRDSRAAVFSHPEEIKAGQIWGINGDDYRLIIVSVNERDVRVVPVSNKIHFATELDFIVPEGIVYYSESVIMPYRIHNISKSRLVDFYYGEIGPVILKCLKDFDRKGALTYIPPGCWYGDTPDDFPEVVEYVRSITEDGLRRLGEIID